MTMEYRPLDDTTFEPVMAPGAEQLEFTVENGSVTGMVSRQGDRTIRYRRVAEGK